LRPLLCLLVGGVVLATGCVHYQFGHRSLYRPDIHTIHVPIFESNTFRRDLGERITEAVCKEIESNTSFKLASASTADSVLKGSLVSEQKLVQGQNGFDEPRILQTDLRIEYRWVDRRGELLSQPVTLDLSRELLRNQVSTGQQFFPEAGQTMVTSQKAAIEDFAKQVVLQLQAPW